MKKLIWIGPDCEEGFVIKGNRYTWKRSSKDYHTFFNEYSMVDVAHKRFFRWARKHK